MTRPTILDLDLVVVPREATDEMAVAGNIARMNIAGGYGGDGSYSAMLSASPYPTAWDDVRKAYGELERERDDSIARETDAWRRANRAESKVKAWEGFVVVRDLPRLAVQTKYFGPGEQDTVSVPKITPEKLTDIINRAAAAEARIAELEAALTAEYGRSNDKCDCLTDDYETIVASKDAELAELNKANVAYVDANTALIGRIAELEKRLADAERVIGDFMDITEPASTPAFKDSQYADEVEMLGERIGFGAMIASASALWRESAKRKGYPDGGEFVVGPCMAVLQSVRRAASAYMEGK